MVVNRWSLPIETHPFTRTFSFYFLIDEGKLLKKERSSRVTKVEERSESKEAESKFRLNPITPSPPIHEPSTKTTKSGKKSIIKEYCSYSSSSSLASLIYPK